jgi:ubiquinone/menaquinone biosynthesis C-methylase UbiE
VDIAVDFFQYIRKKFPDRDMKLFYGTLPDNIHLPNDTFDICVCSQVLHTVPNFTDSITTLFSYVKP